MIDTQKNVVQFDLVQDTQKVTIFLDQKAIQQAKEIGGGDLNKGLITALAVCRVIKNNYK